MPGRWSENAWQRQSVMPARNGELPLPTLWTFHLFASPFGAEPLPLCPSSLPIFDLLLSCDLQPCRVGRENLDPARRQQQS